MVTYFTIKRGELKWQEIETIIVEIEVTDLRAKRKKLVSRLQQ